MSGKKKDASDEDLSLWRASVSGIRPLGDKVKNKRFRPESAVSGNALATASGKKKSEKPAKKNWLRVEPPPAPRRAKWLEALPQNPALPVDRRVKKAIAKGKMPIEATLDLHGQRQELAHRLVRAFILRSSNSGMRAVRIITGKGKREGEGVLRANLAKWLAADAQIRGAILSFSEAAPAHGGGGAFYVTLRRRKN
jgi:DNA-nicking Smr family endonuclease